MLMQFSSTEAASRVERKQLLKAQDGDQVLEELEITNNRVVDGLQKRSKFLQRGFIIRLTFTLYSIHIPSKVFG